MLDFTIHLQSNLNLLFAVKLSFLMAFVLVGSSQYTVVLLRLLSRTRQNTVMLVINLKWFSACFVFRTFGEKSAFRLWKSILLCMDKISFDRMEIWWKPGFLVVAARFLYLISLKYGIVMGLENMDVILLRGWHQL